MNSLSDNQVSIYEEPVQEKVRKFLKLEYLFDKIYYFKGKEDKRDNYNALIALNELYEILARSDIKSELIREVETHIKYFNKIRDSQSVNTDQSKLNSVIEKQELILKLLYNIESNYLDYLDNDVLCKTIFKNCSSTTQPSSVEFWLTRDIVLRETQIDL